MTDLIDLHCHLLPGIDDGAQTPEESSTLLSASKKGGVKRFVFTPHFDPGRQAPERFLSERAEAFAVLSALPEAGGIEYRLGAEIAFTPFFDRLPLEKLTFSGTRFFLLELDTMYARPGVDEAIEWAVSEGFTPILAHVERYPYVEQDPTLLYRWVRAGALAQMNAGFVLRGGAAQKRFLQYAGWGLVHFLASDAHHIEWRPPNLAEGYAKIPNDLAARLQANAQAVFENKRIESPKPIRPERRWGKWR